MTTVEEVELQRRLARFIADRLALTETGHSPMFRLLAAHEAAREIVSRAKRRTKSLERLDARLRQFESLDYEI